MPLQAQVGSRGIAPLYLNFVGYIVVSGYYYYYYYYFQLRTAVLRFIVRSWLDVPTFVTRRLYVCHHAEHPAAEGGTVGEKCPVILPKCQLPRYI
jgi:hypothetical protein